MNEHIRAENERVKILVRGNVQGVFFRETAKTIAKKLGIGGHAKNNKDGSVEIIAEGTREVLQKLIAWCKNGTAQSRVDDVNAEWATPTDEFKDFEIKQ